MRHFCHARLVLMLILGLLGSALLASCSEKSDAAPVIKIGLIAPFEGVGRPLGYAILPEMRQAIADVNASGELGRYRVALVALNDDLDPVTAAAQARALLQDDAVLAVVGPFGGEAAAAVASILSVAGIPTLVPAPLDATAAGVTSLCPLTNEIAKALAQASAELVAAGGPSPLVFFPGDAALAAGELAARRAAGWDGVMLAGPDVLRPWFIQRAGAAAEGTRAAACSVSGTPPAASAALPEASLAEGGIRALLNALAADIRAHGQPSRSGVAAALAEQALAPQLVWYQVLNGAWVPAPSPSEK